MTDVDIWNMIVQEVADHPVTTVFLAVGMITGLVGAVLWDR